MVLNNEVYKHLVFYNINTNHLIREYREKYINIQKENVIGDFPIWSEVSTTCNALSFTESITVPGSYQP